MPHSVGSRIWAYNAVFVSNIMVLPGGKVYAIVGGGRGKL